MQERWNRENQLPDTEALEIATELVRWEILNSVFDGSWSRWINYLNSRATAAQRLEDLDFAERLHSGIEIVDD